MGRVTSKLLTKYMQPAHVLCFAGLHHKLHYGWNQLLQRLLFPLVIDLLALHSCISIKSIEAISKHPLLACYNEQYDRSTCQKEIIFQDSNTRQSVEMP
jgi:hypothetical protein